MDKTKIDWCDSTWNPVTGCLHGCEYCYAKGMAERFSAYDLPHLTEDGVLKRINDLKTSVITECKDGKERICAYPYGFEPTFHRYRLDQYKNKAGRKIFVCSMADLFGEWIPDEWIREVFRACEAAPQHTYLFLTKNPERYYRLEEEGELPGYENMWYGVSATNKGQLEKAVKAVGNLSSTVKTFLSIEPLHEELTQSACWDPDTLGYYFDWIIVGAETGRRPGKVVPEREWIENIVETCIQIGRPVFLKSGRGIMEEICGESLIQQYPQEMKV